MATLALHAQEAPDSPAPTAPSQAPPAPSPAPPAPSQLQQAPAPDADSPEDCEDETPGDSTSESEAIKRVLRGLAGAGDTGAAPRGNSTTIRIPKRTDATSFLKPDGTLPGEQSSHALEEVLQAGGGTNTLIEALRARVRPPAPASRVAPPHPPLPDESFEVRDPLPNIYTPQKRASDSCPNVVLVILDTLRQDRVGCYGEVVDSSPELDKLAVQGVRFANVLSQSSWTRPSIGSLLTSRYPRELGIYEEHEQILPPDFTTLAEVLHDQGYKTIGLTANPNINSNFDFNQGFDAYVDSDVLFNWMTVKQGKLLRGVTPLLSATELFDRAVTLVNETGNEGPYYLQFDLMEVHEWSSTRIGTNMLRPEYSNFFLPGDDYVKYLQMLRQLTDDLGDFVDKLTGMPGWEDTVFVVVSDHGEGLGDHPGVRNAIAHGYTLYESVTRVPWIIYRKGWTPKRPVVEQEVRLLDVVPTLLDMLGTPSPEGVQGVSLLPLIEGRVAVAPLPRYEVIESQFQDTNKIAVYGKRFNYIENRVPQEGAPARELQPRGGHENGTATDVLKQYPEISEGLRGYLESWEQKIPKRPPTAPSRALTPQQVEQLKGIGYL